MHGKQRCMLFVAVLILLGASAPSVQEQAAPSPDVGENAPTEPKPGEVREFDGSEFAWIPPGTFQMGSKLSPEETAAAYGGEKDSFENEHPQHTVTLTNGFWMGVKEVTNHEFERFIQETNYQTTAEKCGYAYTFNPSSLKFEKTAGANWRKLGWEIKADEPVVQVSWNDAKAFCAWLSKKTGNAYRLPTEAEWEYACRAGTTTEFWWGDRIEDGQGKINGSDLTAWPDGKTRDLEGRFPFSDGYWRMAPVGSFHANPWGLYDMEGNVQEWCEDPYQNENYSPRPVKDPKGPAKGNFRIARGGSWYSGPDLCRSANRDSWPPSLYTIERGFRVVRTK